MDSPYEVLGVDADANDDEVVRAYRNRVKTAHPDQGGSVEEFQRVRTAYEAIREGEAADWTEPADDDGDGDDGGRDRPRQCRVEYLNYEVVDDEGWALDDDLFAKAARADLPREDHGRFVVKPYESLLEGAERHGFTWPFACRGGACANCAVAVVDGDLAQPVDHVLSDDLLDRGFRLSCNGIPISRELKVVYNVKHLPGLDELRLPPGPFELAHADD